MGHILDKHIDNYISKQMLKQNKIDRADHISSGKLTASMLGQPLQWQILKVKGIAPKDFEPYVLRKFQRGNDVEAWFIKSTPNVKDTQKELKYRNVVGIADAIVDTKGFDFECGVIPHEVKSVTNMKYKNILRTGEADRGHLLQACLYALALGSEHFAVDYIASDDYRLMSLVYKTSDYQKQVDDIISTFDEQLATGLIPVFIPEEKWQANIKYNNYPEWSDLNPKEINDKYKLLVK